MLKFDFETLPYVDVFLREWRLRWMMRKWNVTIPVLVDDKPVMGGKEILEHVQAKMGAEEPKILRQGVEEWLQIADDVMENERCVLLLRTVCT